MHQRARALLVGSKVVRRLDKRSEIFALVPLRPVFRVCALFVAPSRQHVFRVSCIKHVFESFVALQFDVANRLRDQRLHNVLVKVECRSVVSLTVHALAVAFRCRAPSNGFKHPFGAWWPGRFSSEVEAFVLHTLRCARRRRSCSSNPAPGPADPQ